MPRIPSASEVRSVSAAVTRDPGLRATAEDFGLAAARGLANLGIGVGNFGQGLKQFIEEPENGEDPGGKTEDKKTEDDGADTDSGATPPAGDTGELASTIGNTMAWDDVAASKHHIAWVREQSRLLIEKQQHQGGSPIETAEQSQKGLEASAEEHLNELPLQQRDKAREAAKPVVAGHALSAVQRSQNLKVEALAQRTAETLELLKGQAAADPVSAEKFLADGLDLLSQSHRTGALSDAQLKDRSTAFHQDLYTQMLREQKASDVVADLEAGVYDAALGDPELTQLLLIEHRWRMQGEEAQGRANGEAMVAGAAQGEGASPGLSDATRFLLEAGDFADFELEAEKAQRVRSGVESLRFAPEDEFEGEIAKLGPAVEALDREARLEIAEAVRKGSERLLEERRADPADYAMGLPSVAKAFEAAKENPSLLPSAVSGRLAAQAAMGISPEDQRALSKAEAAEMLQGYKALPAEARAEALKALRDAYGDEIGRVTAELEEAGLPAQMVQALEPGSNVVLVAQVVDAEQSTASGTQADLIAETAEQLIAEGEERSVPPRPGRKLVPTPEDLRLLGDDAPAADMGQMPPMPERRLGSGLHPSQEKLLNKYRPLLEEDEAKVREGLDRSWVAGLGAMIDVRSQENGAPPEMTDLAKRLALRNLRRGGRLENAIRSAFIETGLEQPMISLDTRRYLPELMGLPVDDAKTHMSRFNLAGSAPLHGKAPKLIVDFLREEFSQIREIQRREGDAAVIALWDSVKEIMGEGVKAGLYPGFAQRIRKVGKAALKVPYEHPWSMNDAELGTTLVFLAKKLEESADNAVWKRLASSALDAFPPTRAFKEAIRGGKRIFKVVGISDAISNEEATDILANLVLEAMYRGHFNFEPHLLPGLGISQ